MKPLSETVATIRMQMYLTESQINWLKAESERTGAPVAVLVRRMIDAAITAAKVAQDGS